MTVAAVVGIGLHWVASLHVPMGTHATYLGQSYAQLALDPFHPGSENPVAHRILAPLISYLIGLRGSGLLVTNLIAVVAFLAAVYLWLRSRPLPPAQAILGVATMAFSATVLTTSHYGGYTDIHTYLFIFLAYRAKERPWWCAALYLLALLNHEAALFLAPWFIILLAGSQDTAAGRLTAAHRWARAAVPVMAAVVVFGGVRWLLGRQGTAPEFTLNHYLAPMLADPWHWLRVSAPHRALGIASAFNLLWILPLLAAVHQWRRGDRAGVVVLLLPIPLALAQLLVAYDVTRIATMSFMSVLLGAEYLLRTNGFHSIRWIPVLLIAQSLIPQVNVAMGKVEVMSRRQLSSLSFPSEGSSRLVKARYWDEPDARDANSQHAIAWRGI